jgi:putative endonuclease
MEGQKKAEEFLTQKGYRILTRNYRVKTGEIDLIARDGPYIVFVEVKSRSGLSYGHPREAVNTTKQNRIIQTARQYITRYAITDGDYRFDVVEVLTTQEKTQINHIENAFWLA